MSHPPDLRTAPLELPAIGLTILAVERQAKPWHRRTQLTDGRQVVTSYTAVATVPRADPAAYRVAYLIAAELCGAIDRGISTYNRQLSRLELPVIAEGNARTCVTVSVPCRDAFEAADVVVHLERAIFVATLQDGQRTHRLVRS